jgi:intein-encoded DNA endonuclease-like protein
MKIDYSDVKLNYDFLADLQQDLEDAATDYGHELQHVFEDDEAGEIIEKANGNTRALSRFQAASERLDQALRVVMKQN